MTELELWRDALAASPVIRAGLIALVIAVLFSLLPKWPGDGA